ncbi:MAG: hypothetical protein K6G88_14275 [Lachnospiraceae bacterium]|nr:hypothetical protein [Lachnospiraceae bacterium]
MNGFVKGRVDVKKTIISLLLIVVLEFIAFYMIGPAINVCNVGFWIFQSIFVGIFLLTTFKQISVNQIGYNVLTKVSGGFIILAAVIVVIGSVYSAKIFHAGKYSSLIEVEKKDFATDMPSSEKDVNDIALMDTASAKVVGQRAIGSLSDVISQYEISDSYSTIDFDGEPMKVASLEYAGFFKWINNRSQGVPGYVFVDPVKFEAKYVKLDKAIKYTPSGFFNDNLYRHLRFQYPTYMFEGYYFEVDNEGNPYYICPVLKPHVGLFGAYDVKGIVLCDPCTGKSQYYKVGEIPNWVDRVYDGDLATRKYNWYGTLSGGFINSIIGQKGCKMSTDDYGYKVIDGDVWVYTGVTSVIGDQSNVGFVLINARTCEAIYYTIAGAEEYSAMDAAEGQVQNLGYKAAFPSLINIDGEPTYFMVLKDKSKLVKMYAMVNYKKYSIVATGTTQKDTLANYKKLLKTNNISKGKSEDLYKTKEIVVDSVKYIEMSGETFCYITDADGNVYKQLFAENESLIFVKEGDTLTVKYEESEDGINSLTSYERKENATSISGE